MRKEKYIILLFIVAIGQVLYAQNFHTGYFLDGYMYKYRINPAIANDRTFAGLAVHSVNIGEAGNYGVNSLIFPLNGGYVTGFNKGIPAEQFIGGLKPFNNLRADVSEGILAFGIWKDSLQYHNFEINLRTHVSSSLPRDLFAFLKAGTNGETYDLAKTHVGASAYVEAAYGYSRKINDMFRVGGRVKALVGIANADLEMKKATITISNDQLHVMTNAHIASSANMLSFPIDDEGYFSLSPEFTSNFKPSGFGAAVDLGVSITPVKGLEINVSMLDLGGIFWNYNSRATSNMETIYKGLDNIAINANIGNTIEEEFNEVLDLLTDVIKFKEDKPLPYKDGFKMMSFAVHGGARYQMPFYKGLVVGAAGMYQYDPFIPHYDVRAGLTLTPHWVFSMTANIGYSTYGLVSGAALCLNAPAFNLYVGVDNFVGTYGKINGVTVPVSNYATTLQVGLTIVFGGTLPKDLHKN